MPVFYIRPHRQSSSDGIFVRSSMIGAVRTLGSIGRNAVVLLVVAALAVSSHEAEPRRGGTLVVAGGAGIRHLNPAVHYQRRTLCHRIAPDGHGPTRDGVGGHAAHGPGLARSLRVSFEADSFEPRRKGSPNPGRRTADAGPG